jgi:hypothetical protein
MGAGRCEDVIVAELERRALSGSAPPASTVLRIPLRGTRLRRAVDPGDHCRPGGPDGEGQARGQARKARGEPPYRAVRRRPHPGIDQDSVLLIICGFLTTVIEARGIYETDTDLQ